MHQVKDIFFQQSQPLEKKLRKLKNKISKKLCLCNYNEEFIDEILSPSTNIQSSTRVSLRRNAGSIKKINSRGIFLSGLTSTEHKDFNFINKR